MASIGSQAPDAKFTAFARVLGLALAFAAILPALLALFSIPRGGMYLGSQTNLDDHMVYAAWMRQAAEGRFFFENRFTTDAQSGQFVHLYFWILGQISRILGPVLTVTIARFAFSYGFIQLLAGLIRRLEVGNYASKLALSFAGLGGGLGFLVWHNFGLLIVRPTAAIWHAAMRDQLPIDVWQPEAFTFPSMLTNSLFMVSMCLFVWILIAALDARTSTRAMWGGFAAFALQMNIHSYDSLLVVLVLVAFCVATVRSGQWDVRWVGRVVVMGCGAILPALWFLHVKQIDPVFQARAATPTFSAPFIALFWGIAPLALLAAAGFVAWGRQDRRLWLAVALLVAQFGLLMALFGPGWADGSPSVPVGAWLVAFGLGLGFVALASRTQSSWNLVLSWMAVAAAAPYFPAPFQRKLAAGLAIPFAIVAALALAEFVRERDQTKRNLATSLVVLLLSGSSLLWLTREMRLMRANVSTTTVHEVFLTENERQIVDALAAIPGPKVAAAMPGVPNPLPEVPDEFLSPVMPDLNPILTGLAGAKTIAGHWSETPRYAERRQEILKLFLTQDPSERQARERDLGIEYIVVPKKEAFPNLPIANLSGDGAVLVDGPQFQLIRVGG